MHIFNVGSLPTQLDGTRTRKFCVDWYQQFKWLHWDNRKLLCHTCANAYNRGLILTKRTDESFVSTGYSCNWKKAVENFKTHASSAGHLEACEKMISMARNVNVLNQLDTCHAKDQTEARIALKAISTTLLTLAKTGSAIQGHKADEGNLNSWLDVRSNDIPELRKFLSRRMTFLSRDTQNELLQLMANNVLRQILDRIKRAQFFSIIVDETTDSSIKEQVSISVRYINNDLQPVEEFLGLYDVATTTGEVLTKVIMDCLQRCDLSPQKLRGQCYDGASNMSGKVKGVQSRIKAIQPLALFVHCFAHSLNLALKEAACEVAVVRDSMDYLHKAANLFQRSAKRKSILSDVSATIKPMCPTRWAVRAEAVTTALDNYSGIMNALQTVADESASDENGLEARGLLEQFGKGKMVWALLVAKAVFCPADKLTQSLQGEEMTVNGSLEAITLTRNYLESLRTDESSAAIINSVEQFVNESDLLPIAAPRTRMVQVPRRLDAGSPNVTLSVDQYFRQQYFMVNQNCLNKYLYFCYANYF
jgi:hypothetical protein